MKKILILLFVFKSFFAFCQGKQEVILYIVDSIPILDETEEGVDTLNEQDIQIMKEVTSKTEIAKYGFAGLDKIILITTKEYARRPEKLRAIPRTKLMEKKNDKWYLKNRPLPYTGPYIDYYFNGKKRAEGAFKYGLQEGLKMAYLQDGKKSYSRIYRNGVENGEAIDYFPNGQIKKSGILKNGKEDGLWKYWYSSGQLQKEVLFKDGLVVQTKEDEKFNSLLAKSQQMLKEGNYQGAIKSLDKAIELKSTYSEAYFLRATAFSYDFKFDEAIRDYNKVIELEPLHKDALANRAITRIRKFEFKNNSGAIITASDKVEIPADELVKVCSDLKKAYELGDRKKAVSDAIKTYCR